MEWFSKAFLKSSLAWLAVGVTLGVAMAVNPRWIAFRPAHVHMNLLGFVAMMIFGVAYHVIPRFTGNALHSRLLGRLHWFIANGGLSLMVVGFLLGPRIGRAALPALVAGGVLSALGAYTFIYNVWRTIDGRPPAQAASPVPIGRVTARGTEMPSVAAR
jgi:cytochrome c oxidase cbb3-type subunit 1